MSKNLFILLFLGILVFACSDIFEKDLEDEMVVLLSPLDQLATDILTHIFWWEEVDEATKYNLQIVKPSFNQILKLELDTNVTSTMFEFQLEPGSYQWRVKAFNGSSETAYSVFSLSIDSTLTLTGQKVLLQDPDEDAAMNSLDIEFKWQNITIAEKYELIVKSGTWEDGKEEFTIEQKTTSFDTTLDKEGQYSWAVQARNESSISKIVPSTFEVDTTGPQAPSLTAPAPDFESTSGNITFTWTRPDEGSEITDRILIATDTTFASDKILVNEIRTDKEYPSNIPITVTQDYYWKVIATDKAGNQSAYSERRKFTLRNAK